MLVNCAAYRDGKKIADIAVDEISDYLIQPDCFVWVALHDATPDELAKMQEEFGLHPLAVEDASHGHQRPKIEEYDDTLFAVAHLLQAQGNTFDLGELDIFAGPHFVLSIRNGSARRFSSVRERCEREPELLRQGSGFVLYALLDSVVDRYFPLIDTLEGELEAIEAHMFDKGVARSNITRLYELKQRVTVVKHAVAPLMEGVSKLTGGRVHPLAQGSRDYFRDVYDHLTRINTSLDSIRETISTAIQVSLSAVALEQNDVHKKLAAWAGIFAVATAFAGIWGMNFKVMPELDWKYGYPAALLLISAVCGVLYRRFKRAGWL